MRLEDLTRFAWRALTDRKLRAALTIIGIVIGPATIVALLSVTQGFGNAVTGALASTGSTSIFVTASGSGSYLTYTDVPVIQKMPGVSVVIPFWLLTGTIKQGTQTTTVQVMAGDFSKLDAFLPGLTLSTGRQPSSSDLAGADIGYSIGYPDLPGAANVSVNQIVSVSIPTGAISSSGAQTESEKSFVVRGIFDKFGEGLFINPDTGIFVPLSEGQSLEHTDHYSGIVVVASSASTVNEVLNELTNQYGTTIRAISVSSLVSAISSITGALGLILSAVAGISVIVAFIGIMTTMFTTVVERTKEIGVLKALGYKSSNILSLFLAESAITGFIGGVIGASVGAGLSFVISDVFQSLSSRSSSSSPSSATSANRAGLGLGGGGGFGGGGLGGGSSGSGSGLSALHITPALTPELIIAAIALATAVGAFAGLLPAWRASRLLPVEALYSQ
jgi:putative ABC transport system permease protein